MAHLVAEAVERKLDFSKLGFQFVQHLALTVTLTQNMHTRNTQCWRNIKRWQECYAERAAQRAGELLDEMKAEGKLAKPADTLKKGKVPSSQRMITETKQTLSDLGVKPNQSSQWKELAGS